MREARIQIKLDRISSKNAEQRRTHGVRLAESRIDTAMLTVTLVAITVAVLAASGAAFAKQSLIDEAQAGTKGYF
jgi:hypothetical protein